MRYIETTKGLLIAPRRHFGHTEMFQKANVTREDLLSAGFLAARYRDKDEWKAHGNSAGLNMASRQVSIPTQLYVGTTAKGFLLFSDNPELLTKLENVVPAVWGMSEEGCEGSCAVFAPLHPEISLSADSIIRDW